MSAPRDQRGLLIGIAVALLFAALVVGQEDPENTDTRLTPVSTAPGGGKLLADTLTELGLARARLDRPWSDWVVDDPRATLAVVGPTSPVDDFEVDRLVAWLERGGRLVWVPAGLVRSGLAWSRPDAALADALGVTSRTARRLPGESDDVRAAPAEDLPTAARLALAGAPERFEIWTRAFDIDRPHTAWVTDGAGRPCVAEVEVGRGRVLVWGNATPLRNDLAAERAAAATFVRAAAVFADDAPLVIDGYGHGLAALGSVHLATWRWLTRTDGGAVALLALGVGLVWLAAASVRRAPPVQPPLAPGRSSVEHVEALAQAYARAHAHARPARLLLEHAEQRLGAVSLEQRLAHLRRTHPQLAARIERVERARSDPASVPPNGLVGLSHDLDAIVRAGTAADRRTRSAPAAVLPGERP